MTTTSPFIDHRSHAQPHIQPFPGRLHVVTAIINPQRFRSRYELFWAFEKRVRDAGAILHVAEVAFGGRPFEVTEAGHPNHLQLRTSVELWHKENALNLLIANAIRQYPEAQYFAWVDADVQFARPDWAQETLHQLQHYHVVQMWSMCQDLAPTHEVIAYDEGGEQLPGMVYQNIQSGMYGKYSEQTFRIDPNDPYSQTLALRANSLRSHPGHSGYAWAATRSALDTLGGLIDWSACGANDHHMARGLLGDISESVNPGASAAFKESLRLWGERAEALKPKVGYVPGLISHFWHGPKRNRQYLTRWKILNESQFDPALDMKKDTQGLYQLTGRNRKLTADLMAYFRQRNEDSVDL
jgi:hypothetical protein